MNKIELLFLEALKASLENKKVDWKEDLTIEEWNILFQMAEVHHVLPMIFEAVFACDSAQKMDPSFFMPYKQRVKKLVMMQMMKTMEFLRLYSYLSKKEIHPIMVKGIICRELYPNPDYRISGDEDMLICPDTFSYVHEAMSEYGMVVADEKADIEKDYEIPYGKKGSPIYIELHKHLFPPNSQAYGEFNTFFENVHEERITLKIQGIDVKTMEYSMHLFYLITHAFKHFLHSGFGIRQVCDIIMFANAYGEKIDWDKVLKQCQSIHAEIFSATLFTIGKKYLNFDEEKSKYPEFWKALKADEMALLKDLLQSGVYGNSDMSRKHSSNITLNAVSSSKAGKEVRGSILKTIFPKREALVGRYTYLHKYPFLLPVAWCDRILKYRKETKNLSSNNAAESIKIGNQRIELLRQYGIIEK